MNPQDEELFNTYKDRLMDFLVNHLHLDRDKLEQRLAKGKLSYLVLVDNVSKREKESMETSIFLEYTSDHLLKGYIQMVGWLHIYLAL